MPNQSPGDLSKLIDSIIAKFEARNQQAAADKLRRIQETAFTTSSELLGELGLAVRSIQKETQLDREMKQDLDHVMRAVKKAWPRL